MSDLTHLITDAPNTEETMDTLQRLKELISLYELQEERVKTLENELAEAKAQFNKTSQEEIPNLLLQSGLGQIKTPWGKKVTIKREVSPTIVDMQRFEQFLTEKGGSDIVKTTMEFGKLDTSVVRSIQKLIYEKLDILPETKQTIHPMTLKKYIKELCLVGEENPEYDEHHIPLEQLPDCVKVFSFYKTTIK